MTKAAKEHAPKAPMHAARARAGAHRPYLAYLCVLVSLVLIVLARTLLVPILIGLLAALLLSPAVGLLARLHIPRVIGAAVAILLALGVLLSLLMVLAQPAQQWLAQAPTAIQRLEQRIEEWRKPLQAASRATEGLVNLAQGGAAKTTTVAASPSPLLGLLQATPAVAASILACVFLAFIVLIHEQDLLRKLTRLVPDRHSQKDVLMVARNAQAEVSRYLLSIAAINTVLGLVCALAFYLLDAPDPLLWGGVVGVLNFAPYVGPALSTVVLLVVGYSQPDQTASAITLPAVFLVLHGLESQVVTPHLVGSRLALDPVVIFLALMMFGWAWGVAGLLMAVPMLACLKIVAQRLPGGEPWATLLGAP